MADAATDTKDKNADDASASKIRIRVRSFDHKIIDQSVRNIIDAIERSGAKPIGPVPLPTEKKVITVNRSTFVHKDARDQFELRTHKRLIDIASPTSKTVDILSNLNLPAGVDIEIKMS